MNTTDARAIVGNAWTGRSANDARLSLALETLGMTRVEFDRLANEARRVEVGRHGLCILTPSGRGRRSR
jgi:hypothetical protein